METKPEYTVDPASIERANVEAWKARLLEDRGKLEQLVQEQLQNLANTEKALAGVRTSISVVDEILKGNKPREATPPESPTVSPTPLS